MKIGEIFYKDVFCYSHLKIALPRCNDVVVVHGEKEGRSDSSIGVGKSSLFEGVKFTLLGSNAKGSAIGGIIKNKCDKCVGRIGFDGCVVSRGRGIRSFFKLDGVKYKYSEGAKIVYDMFHITNDIWNNCLFYSQMEGECFAYLSPRDRKEFLSELLHLIIYQKCFNELWKKYKNTQREQYSVEGKIASLSETYIQLKRDMDSAVKSSKRALKIQKTKTDKIKKELDQLRVEEKSLLNIVDRWSSRLRQLKRELVLQKRLYKEKICKRCGQEIRGTILKHAGKRIRSLSGSLKEAEQVERKEAHKLRSLRRDINRLKNQFGEEQEVLIKLRENVRAKDSLRNLSKLKINIKKYKEELGKLENEINILEKASAVFHRDGFPRYYAGVICHLLNSYLKELAQSLDSDLTPQIRLEDFSIEVLRLKNDEENTNIRTCSGGERKVLNILLFLAFNKIYRYLCDEMQVEHCDFMVLDETLSQLDRSTVNTVIKFLRSYARAEGLTIFLITNDLWLIRRPEWKNKLLVKRTRYGSKVVMEK